MTLKKVLALVLALVMVVSLVACGKPQTDDITAGQNDTTADVSTSAAPDTTAAPIDYSKVGLEIVWWGEDTRHKQTIEIVEEFEKLHPGLKVQVSYAGFNDHNTMLTTQAAGNNLPDVMQLGFAKLAEFARNDLLMPLDDLVANGTIDWTNMSDIYTNGGIVDGKMYAQVAGVNSYCMYYDATLLADNGITIDQNPTFTEFLGVCKQVYEKTGVKSYLSLGYERYFEMYLRSLGADLMDPTNTKAGFTSEQLFDYLNIAMDAIKADFYANDGDTTVGETELIGAGESWVVHSQTNTLNAMQRVNGDKEISIFTHPEADARTQAATFLRPAMMWSIAADTEYPELAAEFLSFYANETVVYDISGQDRGVPISSEIRAYLAERGTPSDAKVNAFLDYLAEDGNSTQMSAYLPSGFAQAWTSISESIEQMKFGLIAREDLPKLAQELIDGFNASLASAS